MIRSQRERILDALADSCAEKGYGPTTVADIVGRAGVSRATFYELFRDKEECFFAAMELILNDTMVVVSRAYSDDKPWSQIVIAGIAGILELMAGKPAYAHLGFVEFRMAGPLAYERYGAGIRVLVAALDRGRDDPTHGGKAIPASAGRAVLGAAETLVVDQILAGRTDRLPELLPDLVYIALVPYVGQEDALRQSQAAEQAVDRR